MTVYSAFWVYAVEMRFGLLIYLVVMKFFKQHSLLVAVLLLLVVALGVWVLRGQIGQSTDSGVTDLSNVRVQVPLVESEVVLENGTAQLPSEDEASGGTVTVSAPYATAGEDQFAIMSVNYGGSGTFVYLVMFAPDEQGALVQSGLYSLGDRVVVESINPQGGGSRYSVLVTYLGYAAGESYADQPTERVSANVPIINHSIMSTGDNTSQ